MALTPFSAGAQTAPGSGPTRPWALTVTWAGVRNNVSYTGAPFWLDGLSADFSTPIYRRWEIAGAMEWGQGTIGGSGLQQVSFMAGPRYRFDTSALERRWLGWRRRTAVFGEWLLGVAFARHGTFPGANGAAPNAHAFSSQLGGGLEVALDRGFWLRAIDLDWMHTSLPNGSTNAQNGLRLAAGVSFRWGR